MCLYLYHFCAIACMLSQVPIYYCMVFKRYSVDPYHATKKQNRVYPVAFVSSQKSVLPYLQRICKVYFSIEWPTNRRPTVSPHLTSSDGRVGLAQYLNAEYINNTEQTLAIFDVFTLWAGRTNVLLRSFKTFSHKLTFDKLSSTCRTPS